MVMTLSQKFFDDYNLQIMEVMNKKMPELTFRNQCFDQALGEMVQFKFCVYDQELQQFDIDFDNSRIIIDAYDKKLKLKVQISKLYFSSRFEITSEPKWLTDGGSYTASVINSSITMDLKTLMRENIIQIDFANVLIDIGQYDVKIDGGTDFSRAVEIIFNSFKTFF